MYYGQHGNASLNSLFYGSSKNISMEEIYGAHYNSSIYQFTVPTGNPGEITMAIIEVTLISLTGLDGSQPKPSGLLQLSLLSASSELCATFFFLWDSSVKDYLLSLTFYAEPKKVVSMKGFMSLTNQARSLDRFQLFDQIALLDNKMTRMDFLVTSLKFLQKRNTAAEPCIDVDNYDKVSKFFSVFSNSSFYICS